MTKTVFEIDSVLDNILTRLARKQNLKKPEMLRRTVALMKFLDNECLKGNRVAITDSSGQVIREILIPQG
jgi:hypothetical protein